MRNGVMRMVFGGFFFVGTSWGAIAGCSSSNSAGYTPAPDASLTCPATVTAAIGAACSQEGQVCPIGYPCGSFAQQAHCECTKGKFVCTDATGAAVDTGATPQCVGNGTGNDAECPANEKGTQGKACTTAGLVCSYLGLVCSAGAQPLMDQCQCVGSSTSNALAFVCEPKQCNPGTDASLPDTNAPPVDSGADAGGG